MKIFMYEKNYATKNNCYTDKNPNNKLRFSIILLSLEILIPILGPILFLLIDLLLVDLNYYNIIFPLLWIIGIGLSINQIYSLIKWLDKYETCRRTAIIKENNTFWAVRLTFIPEIGSSININAATSVASTISNIKKAQFNQKMQDELYNNREIAEKYINVLNESRKPDVAIIRDINKNYKYIFNGSAAIIRLDNLKLIKDKKDSEIYSYTDNNNKTKKIEIFKVYPGLKEEIINTHQDKHFDKFPQFTEEHKKTFKSNNKAIFVISIITILLILIRVISNNYDCSNKLTSNDKEYVYNYLESTYGNGEKLTIYKEKISCFEKDDNIIGTEIFVMGYFNSDETVYTVMFRKYHKNYFDYEIDKMYQVAEHHYNKSDLNINT